MMEQFHWIWPLTSQSSMTATASLEPVRWKPRPLPVLPLSAALQLMRHLRSTIDAPPSFTKPWSLHQ